MGSNTLDEALRNNDAYHYAVNVTNLCDRVRIVRKVLANILGFTEGLPCSVELPDGLVVKITSIVLSGEGDSREIYILGSRNNVDEIVDNFPIKDLDSKALMYKRLPKESLC